MKKTQIKNCNITPGSWKKGKSPSIKGKGSRKGLINRHHVDLDKLNNRKINILYLIDGIHQSLHKRAYDYLVETKQIRNYICWFIRKYEPRIYTEKEYIGINKLIRRRLQCSIKKKK